MKQLSTQTSHPVWSIAKMASNSLANVTPTFSVAAGQTQPFGTNTISVHEQSELFKDYKTNSFVKKYEVTETTEDILAASCAWYRVRGVNSHNFTSLLDRNVFAEIKEDDRIKANEIRDYYSKKCMVWSLKEMRFSEFRKDLHKFVNTDGKKFVEAILPLVFRLPEFYAYDIEFDEMRRELTLEIPNWNERMATAHDAKILELTPIKMFEKRTKRVKCFEYWMKDSSGHAYVILLDTNNPLKGLWEREFNRARVNMSGLCYPKRRDELQYFQLLKYEVLDKV